MQNNYYNYNGNYGEAVNKKPFELYLCPPYNSHKLKISNKSYESFEYFLHSDNSKIIQVENSYNTIIVRLSNQNGTIYDKVEFANEY